MQSKDRYFAPPNQSIDDIPADIQHLYICGLKDYEFDYLIFSNNPFYQLNSITIGSKCFLKVRKFVISGLPNLERVEIDNSCFYKYDAYSHHFFFEEDEFWNEPVDGICRITNCPNLTQLEIGNGSFQDFKSFELSNLNSIQSINFGNYCFFFANLSIIGM